MDQRVDNDAEAWLQLKPVEPLPSQCCGSGCSPCVFDLYSRDLERWEAARARNDRSLLSGKQSPETQGCSTKLSPETFLAFHISAIEKLTKDTLRVRFTLPGNNQLGLHPGQHLILRGIADGLEIQRAYTPISPVTAEGYFDVLIKAMDLTRLQVREHFPRGILGSINTEGPLLYPSLLARLCHYPISLVSRLRPRRTKVEGGVSWCYQAGLMSQYVESWRTGDTAFWRGPFGSFLYEPNKYGELLMLAAGTGLAPMVPILHSITDNADDETFVTLVCCFKTFESIYLKTFLQEQARFWNVRTFFVLSQEVSPEQLPWSYREKTHFGRLGQELVDELVACCRRKPFTLVCGSSSFTEDMARCLLSAGLTEDSYFLF